MKRRDFFEKAGLGSALLVLPTIEAASGTRTAQQSGRSQGREEEEHKHDRHDDMNGPLASATVSFGQWDLTQPLDRFPNNSPRQVNNHQLIPKEVVIKAGGSVNFVISGFHHILVYGNGTKPSDINVTMLIHAVAGASAAAHRRSDEPYLPRPRPERAACAASRTYNASGASSSRTSNAGPRGSRALPAAGTVPGDLRCAAAFL